MALVLVLVASSSSTSAVLIQKLVALLAVAACLAHAWPVTSITEFSHEQGDAELHGTAGQGKPVLCWLTFQGSLT